jgi:hypothetical protein
MPERSAEGRLRVLSPLWVERTVRRSVAARGGCRGGPALHRQITEIGRHGLRESNLAVLPTAVATPTWSARLRCSPTQASRTRSGWWTVSSTPPHETSAGTESRSQHTWVMESFSSAQNRRMSRRHDWTASPVTRGTCIRPGCAPSQRPVRSVGRRLPGAHEIRQREGSLAAAIARASLPEPNVGEPAARWPGARTDISERVVGVRGECDPASPGEQVTAKANATGVHVTLGNPISLCDEVGLVLGRANDR